MEWVFNSQHICFPLQVTNFTQTNLQWNTQVYGRIWLRLIPVLGCGFRKFPVHDFRDYSKSITKNFPTKTCMWWCVLNKPHVWTIKLDSRNECKWYVKIRISPRFWCAVKFCSDEKLILIQTNPCINSIGYVYEISSIRLPQLSNSSWIILCHVGHWVGSVFFMH